ncbi:nucleotidyltransferase [Candidatus Daviesbacteria bacterium]|nr:nucleotidyltransferase [Candidatus Daviesbacteria bacterium]
MSWEDTFRTWANPPSESERERCANAEKAICDAFNSDEKLSQKNILVFAQGSYKANTHVRLDSDVDICIMLKDTFFAQYPEGHSQEIYGNTSSSFTYGEFKNLVESALISHFGSSQVTRGNKAFDVHANSYRVDADVIPTFEHRRYTGRRGTDGNHHYHQGVEFRPDNGGSIINWPDQSYQNGVDKNSQTSRRYKSVVRILKRLRNKMQEEDINDAGNIASFLIESLVWNAPKSYFGHDNIYDDVREVLAHIYNATIKQENCNEWGEVNELKYLFRDAIQPWTRDQAHRFLSAAWDYVSFK